MNIKMRVGVFETNSSSVHSLVFHKTDVTNVVNDNVMEIHGGEFGRAPQEALFGTENRLNYLWTAIWEINYEYFDYDKQEWAYNLEEIAWWKNAIHLYCPNAILYDLKDDGSWDYPFVDHADLVKPLLDAMKQDITILRYYLLDPDGYILIDGDEYERFYDEDLMPPIGWQDSDRLVQDGDNYYFVKTN